jgi:hypothetical protein
MSEQRTIENISAEEFEQIVDRFISSLELRVYKSKGL